ncbi:putative U3 small nucleolar RNA-associated protein 7 [Exaiptasia diaphana]|nr:putative U3 small nucleolar RNA-associated protein 7 [Exaiptasia diaphana]
MLKRYEGYHNNAALQAARAELLLTEEPGFLESEGLEKTYRFKQHDIAKAVDVASAQKFFDLKLDKFGPYRINYTRNGRFMLIAGQKGHIASIEWQSKKLTCEVHVKETVRDAKWLHIETMFAVAQKKAVYIYDNKGIELHCIKKHAYVNRMEFLPHHFLLATVGNYGVLRYQDTSTGKMVAEHRTRLGRCDAMTQNPWNAILHLGHFNGTVTLWSPTIKDPLVKMLCHKGPVQAVAIDNRGLYMVTTGLDGRMKIWDVRTYKQLHNYSTYTPASNLSISQRGLLAVGFGPNVEVWQNAFSEKQKAPYMKHLIPSCSVHSLQFCPFEDVLGIGHSQGISSILIPGSGEPNYDALETNPYQTKKQRQESEVKSLLEKIQPEFITLDPMDVNKVRQSNDKEEDEAPQDTAFEPKYKKKGRSSSAKMYSRKKGHLEEEKRKKIRKKMADERKQNREEKIESARKTTSALDRFKKKPS